MNKTGDYSRKIDVVVKKNNIRFEKMKNKIKWQH